MTTLLLVLLSAPLYLAAPESSIESPLTKELNESYVEEDSSFGQRLFPQLQIQQSTIIDDIGNDLLSRRDVPEPNKVLIRNKRKILKKMMKKIMKHMHGGGDDDFGSDFGSSGYESIQPVQHVIVTHQNMPSYNQWDFSGADFGGKSGGFGEDWSGKSGGFGGDWSGGESYGGFMNSGGLGGYSGGSGKSGGGFGGKMHGLGKLKKHMFG